jgi:hypothetical protein
MKGKTDFFDPAVPNTVPVVTEKIREASAVEEHKGNE